MVLRKVGNVEKIMRINKVHQIKRCDKTRHVDVNIFTYRSKWISLNKRSLRQLGIGLVIAVDAFPRQSLQNGPMIEIVVIRVRIDIAQRHAIDFGIGKTSDDLWLQMILILEITKHYIRIVSLMIFNCFTLVFGELKCKHDNFFDHKFCQTKHDL